MIKKWRLITCRVFENLHISALIIKLIITGKMQYCTNEAVPSSVIYFISRLDGLCTITQSILYRRFQIPVQSQR